MSEQLKSALANLNSVLKLQGSTRNGKAISLVKDIFSISLNSSSKDACKSIL